MAKIKSIQKVGTSKGVVIDKAILELLNLDHEAAAVEFVVTPEGLLLKPTKIDASYKKISSKHRKALDKLGE